MYQRDLKGTNLFPLSGLILKTTSFHFPYLLKRYKIDTLVIRHFDAEFWKHHSILLSKRFAEINSNILTLISFPFDISFFLSHKT